MLIVSQSLKESNVGAGTLFKNKHMRLITFILLLMLCFSCAGTKNAAMNPGKSNGTRVPVKQEISGTQLPKAAFENQSSLLGTVLIHLLPVC